ncbi:hypothetical protein ACFONC_03135, partial [Luteimonas soli]
MDTDALKSPRYPPLALRHCAIGSLCLTRKNRGRNLRLFQQSAREIMDNRGRFVLAFAAAAMLSLGFSAPALAQRAASQVYLPAKAGVPDSARTAEDSQRLIDQVAAEANARTRAGQPAEDVEAWMATQLEQAGMTVESAPPAWDVFGSAKWEQENPGADSADNREPNQDGIATIDGFNSRNPVDGRYEQTEAKEDPQFRDEKGSRQEAATGEAGQGSS